MSVSKHTLIGIATIIFFMFFSNQYIAAEEDENSNSEVVQLIKVEEYFPCKESIPKIIHIRIKNQSINGYLCLAEDGNIKVVPSISQEKE